MSGRYEEAVALYEAAYDAYRETVGEGGEDTLQALSNLGVGYLAAGRKNEAVEVHREVLRLRRKVVGPRYPTTVNSMGHLGRALMAVGRPEEAIPLLEEAIAIREEFYPANKGILESLHQSLRNARKIVGPDEGGDGEAAKVGKSSRL